MLDCISRTLGWGDTSVDHVFYINPCHDEEIAEMVSSLIYSLCKIQDIHISCIHLTDKIGVQLARRLYTSNLLIRLILPDNDFGPLTYVAIATYLLRNTSLQYLSLVNNQKVEKNRVNAVFVNSLRLNKCRPQKSTWCLYMLIDEFPRLNLAACKSSPPSMLEFLLCVNLDIKRKEK